MTQLPVMLFKSKSESPLEKKFEDQLLEYGIILDQQFFVGPFRIDFGIKDKRICFEVDSMQYHSNYTQIAQDNRRQDYIEKKGWKVLRIPSWLIYSQKGLAAAEIALRYFKDTLTTREKMKALFTLERYFNGTEKEIEEGLTKEIDKLVEEL